MGVLVDLDVTMHTKSSAVLMQWVETFIPCRFVQTAQGTQSAVVVLLLLPADSASETMGLTSTS